MVLFMILLILMVSGANAQVNIEAHRGRPGVSGKFTVQYGGATGNSEFFDGGATANLTYNSGTYTALLVGRGLLGFASGERFSNQGLAHVRFTWTRRPGFQPEIFGQLDYARPRRLVSRALVGGGVRRVLHDTEVLALSMGNSLMWEREKLDLPDLARHPEISSFIRSSSYMNLQFSGKVKIRLTGYYQFRVVEMGDARLLGDLEVTSAIIGPLEQTTSVRYRLDTDPPDVVQKNDLHIGTSLGLRF